MKKIAIGVLIVFLLAGQAQARKVKTGSAAGLRMNAAINRVTPGKKTVPLPSEAKQRPSRLFSNTSPDSSPDEALEQGGTLQPPGDRPFDGGASAVNPFAPPASLPGTMWSPPIPLNLAISPFVPPSSGVNPFQGSLSNPMLSSPTAPGFSAPVVQSNPATKANRSPTSRTAIQSAGALPTPWSNPGQSNGPLFSHPISAIPSFSPRDSQVNPFSLENLFPSSSSGFR